MRQFSKIKERDLEDALIKKLAIKGEITYEDLSIALRKRINSGGGGTGGGSYDDTELLEKIKKLEEGMLSKDEADKTYPRLDKDSISTRMLDPDLKKALGLDESSSSCVFATMEELDKYRKLDSPIAKSDLTKEVTDLLDQIGALRDKTNNLDEFSKSVEGIQNSLLLQKETVDNIANEYAAADEEIRKNLDEHISDAQVQLEELGKQIKESAGGGQKFDEENRVPLEYLPASVAEALDTLDKISSTTKSWTDQIRTITDNQNKSFKILAFCDSVDEVLASLPPMAQDVKDIFVFFVKSTGEIYSVDGNPSNGRTILVQKFDGHGEGDDYKNSPYRGVMFLEHYTGTYLGWSEAGEGGWFVLSPGTHAKNLTLGAGEDKDFSPENIPSIKNQKPFIECKKEIHVRDKSSGAPWMQTGYDYMLEVTYKDDNTINIKNCADEELEISIKYMR